MGNDLMGRQGEGKTSLLKLKLDPACGRMQLCKQLVRYGKLLTL